MLYDGALKNIAAGKAAMERADTFRQNESLLKAQKIVAELISCLDMDKGGEIAQNLLALYSFCYNKLVEANIGDTTEGLDHATEVLRDLRSGWVELEQSLRIQGADAAA